MLTEKDYCDYETCVALKELGYKGKGHYTYKIGCQELLFQIPILTVRTASALGHLLAIHIYSAQKWLREEKQMVLLPAYINGANIWICEICYKRERLGFGGYNQTYEEALSEGINEAVKILKEK